MKEQCISRMKLILFYLMVFVSILFIIKCYHKIFYADIHIQAARKLHIEVDTDTNYTMKKGKLIVGRTLQLKANTSEIAYHSSDSMIACVSEEGKVTGKKSGTIVITAKKDGYIADKIKITVIKKKKMPVLPVTVDEITIEDTSLQEDENGDMIFSARVKNHAKKRKAKKVVLTYQAEVARRIEEHEKVPTIEVEDTTNSAIGIVTEVSIEHEKVPTIEAEDTTNLATGVVTEASIEHRTETDVDKVSMISAKRTISLVLKNIPAGKVSKRAYCKGDRSGDVDNMKLQKIEVYSGNALHVYHVKKDKYQYKWGTVDKKAPRITGWIKKDSVSKGEPLRVCYPDRQESYRFKQHVKAFDERAGKVKLTVDTSKINWKKAGIYKVKYVAKDKAGNVAKTWAKVEVRMVDTVAEIADKILASITKKSWSDERKARAIYSYVKSHCTYVGHGTHTNWSKVAVNAFRYGSGDCFSFYSMAKALLTRAGIPNVTITRYPLRNGAHHWWHLVYVRGGWYHFDTTPRSIRGYFCLVTDKQLAEYRDSGAFRYASSGYPKRGEKAISHGCNVV